MEVHMAGAVPTISEYFLNSTDQERGVYAANLMERYYTEGHSAEEFAKQKQTMMIVSTVALSLLLFLPISLFAGMVLGGSWGVTIFSAHMAGFGGLALNRTLENKYYHEEMMVAMQRFEMRTVIRC